MPHNRRTAAFERRVARALEAAADVNDRARPLLVACSGGPDSTAALVAVARASATSGRQIIAACFDHRLRPRSETELDAAFVGRLATCLGVELRTGAARGTRGASEAAARESRYRWLGRVARDVGAVEVVTGHILDDQAETVLLRLTRGTGVRGLAGMAPRSAWPVRGGAGLSVLRPLLALSRADVAGYLAALGIEARRDASNDDLSYARNRIRHRVLPELRRINPRGVEAIARAAVSARRDDEALEAWARSEAARLVHEEDGRMLEIDRAALRALPPAVARRVLRGSAERLGIAVDAAQLDAMWRASGRRGRQISLSGGRFWVEREVVAMRRV